MITDYICYTCDKHTKDAGPKCFKTNIGNKKAANMWCLYHLYIVNKYLTAT